MMNFNNDEAWRRDGASVAKDNAEVLLRNLKETVRLAETLANGIAYLRPNGHKGTTTLLRSTVLNLKSALTANICRLNIIESNVDVVIKSGKLTNWSHERPPFMQTDANAPEIDSVFENAYRGYASAMREKRNQPPVNKFATGSQEEQFLNAVFDKVMRSNKLLVDQMLGAMQTELDTIKELRKQIAAGIPVDNQGNTSSNPEL